jgi:hypothetical protein
MDTGKMTKAYVKLRDARTELKREFEEKDSALKAKQELLENQMLKFLQDNNTDSVKTASGTFYRQEEITPTGADWEAFYQWVAANNAFDFLERRIKKTSIKEYMEMNNGGIPPGVNVYREFVCRVRRS